MRVLAIDPGKKRVGVAVSDPTGVIARPLVTLDGGDRYRLIGELCRLIEDHQVAEVVVGLPLHLDGTAGASAHKARWLRDRLAHRLEIPVLMVDERLSSVAAAEIAPEEPDAIDRVAAAVILQAYLDQRRKERHSVESNGDSL